MNEHPSCRWWRWCWLVTLACSPGVGVGVLECWGVCTKGCNSWIYSACCKWTIIHQHRAAVNSTHRWNGICQDLVNHRVKFRRLLPKLSGRAHLWGKMVFRKGVKRAVRAISEVRSASTSAWVSGTPLSTAPRSTCSSITWECKAEHLSQLTWPLHCGNKDNDRRHFLTFLSFFVFHTQPHSVIFRVCVYIILWIKFGGIYILWLAFGCFCLSLYDNIYSSQLSHLTCWSNRRLFVGIAASDL